MKSRFTAFMDGVSLNEIDDRILITEVMHYPATAKYDSTAIAKRTGSNVIKENYTYTECRISFILRVYRVDERQRVCSEIARWANGKVLEVGDRPGQILRCVCTQKPAINSAEFWLQEITMIFAGYDTPFWEEKLPSELTLDGDDAEGYLFVPGNIGKPLVGVEVTPKSGTLTSLVLTVDDYTITLANLNVSTSDTVTISYDERQIQSIKVGEVSVLSKRTSASSDDLIAKVGDKSECAVIANVPVRAKFTARGLWL